MVLHTPQQRLRAVQMIAHKGLHTFVKEFGTLGWAVTPRQIRMQLPGNVVNILVLLPAQL
jgi:hypothetical protein